MTKPKPFVVIVVAIVCLSVDVTSTKNKDAKKDDFSSKEEMCKKLGFTKPIKSADIDECNVICSSKDDSLVEHFEVEGNCSWKGGSSSICKYGQCYDPKEPIPEMDLDDYAVVEIIPKQFEVKSSLKVEANLEFDAFLEGQPSDSLTHEMDYVFCSCPANNTAGIKTVPFKTTCKTRLLNRKAKLAFALSTSKGDEIAVATTNQRVGKMLDKGVLTFPTKEGDIFSVEMKTGKRNKDLTKRAKSDTSKRPKLSRDAEANSSKKPKSSSKPKSSRKPKSTKRPKTSSRKPKGSKKPSTTTTTTTIEPNEHEFDEDEEDDE